MDCDNNLQDVIRCHFCEIPAPQLHCDTCHTNLCKVCAGEHLMDETKNHKVLPIKKRSYTPTYPTCPKHITKQCKLHCEQCDKAICIICVASVEHKQHKAVDIMETFQHKKEIMEKDLKELEMSIFPHYKRYASVLPAQRADLQEKCQKWKRYYIEQEEDCHAEIIKAIVRKKSEISGVLSKYQSVLDNLELELQHKISEIAQIIHNLKDLLNSNDMNLVSSYKSCHDKFRQLPPKFEIFIPNTIPKPVNAGKLCEQFASMSLFTITAEKNELPGDELVSFHSEKLFLNQPSCVTAIRTEQQHLHSHSVVCLSDEELWTKNQNNIMKLFNIEGKLLKSIKTISGNVPEGIAVTKNGDLVYTDSNEKTVNIVKNDKIELLVSLCGWIPLDICSTSSDDFLVIMISDDYQKTKIVRYSGSTEIQSFDIQLMNDCSTTRENNIKHITENNNFDICVADYNAKMVFVLNKVGKLRFSYTGCLYCYRTILSPSGITTDSQSRILIADYNNDCIHIINENGQFLCCIDNCDLRYPCGLCVDTKDNLFVAEGDTGLVKKIQYYT